MFTGLVQAVGQVERRGRALLVGGCSAFAPLQLGDSVTCSQRIQEKIMSFIH